MSYVRTGVQKRPDDYQCPTGTSGHASANQGTILVPKNSLWLTTYGTIRVPYYHIVGTIVVNNLTHTTKEYVKIHVFDDLNIRDLNWTKYQNSILHSPNIISRLDLSKHVRPQQQKCKVDHDDSWNWHQQQNNARRSFTRRQHIHLLNDCTMVHR